LSVVSPDFVGKSLELLTEAVPGVSRAALLLKPDSMPDRARKERLEAAEVAARALKVRLQVIEVGGPEDFARAFSDMTRARAGALYVLTTPVFEIERRRLVDLAAKNRLPTVYAFKGWAEDGGLMSYGPDIADLYRRAATYVAKILKGAKPADLAVEQPTKFELVINLKTAKALGLTIPQSLLQRADQVIE
jgi:putative tryptophan/tyrosine transport system substrate-binding protein